MAERDLDGTPAGTDTATSPVTTTSAAPSAGTGVETAHSLPKRVLNASLLRWYFFHLSSASYDRLEAFGFLHSMLPVINHLYKHDEEARRAAMKRHSVFYNTEPLMGSLIAGVAAGMEEQKAAGAELDDKMINGVKVGLMGPLAGIGDALVQLLLVPILLGIGMGLAKGGSLVGPLFYVVVFLPLITFLAFMLHRRGYRMGVKAVDEFVGEKGRRMQEAFAILGLTVMGAIAASWINLPVKLEIKSEGLDPIVIQKILDTIFPKLMSLLVVLGSFWMMRKRRMKPLAIILVYIVVITLGVLVGLF